MTDAIYTLCIESATKNCSVAIFKNTELLCLCEEFSEEYSHAEKLHLFIEWALQGAGIKLKDLHAICIGEGPGSYTGLRIGTAAVKGLCFALHIPLIAVNTLSLLIKKTETEAVDYIIPMLDARRMEVYTQVYNKQKNETSIIEAKIIDQTSYDSFKENKVLFIGDGIEKCQPLLNHKNFKFITDAHPSANEMGEIAFTKYKNKEFQDIAYFEPLYLKDFIAEKSKKNILNT